MFYIGIDLGTSATKLLLTDENGTIANTVSKSYDVEYPKPGWSQQNPEDWWGAVVAGVHELVAGIDVAQVRGIGTGGQMHGLVALDANNTVIRPCILWNDGRTEKEVTYLNETIGRERLSKLTGNIAFAGFTVPKILWMQKHEPENFKRIAHIMLPKDYLTFRMTGQYATDYSDASGMLLLDVEHRCWSAEMLDICGISEAVMPTLYDSAAAVGTLSESAAAELGLPAGVVVAAGAGDNAAAAIGCGVVTDGSCNISLGTSGTVFIPSDTFKVDAKNALHSFDYVEGQFHLMGCILSAASCSAWLMDNVLKSSDYAGEDAPIDAASASADLPYFLPYLMGERSPYNDVTARGAFIGMRADTSRADMVRAVREGVAFAIRDCIEVAREQGIVIRDSSLCGGGSRSELMCQILANILNIELKMPETVQGPGYGACMLAMVAAGDKPSVRECAQAIVKTKATIAPDAAAVSGYEARYQIWRQMYPALKPIYQQMAK